jgi:hypothetical protein
MFEAFEDMYGDSFSGALMHTGKLAVGIALGRAVYVFGAVPAAKFYEDPTSKTASLTYAGLMGVASVFAAQKWAKRSDLVMAGAASVLGHSIGTVIATTLAPEPAAAAPLPALPARGSVQGIFDLDNKQAVEQLIRMPVGLLG